MRNVFVNPNAVSNLQTSPRSALVIGWRWKDQWCHQGRYPGGEVWHSAMVKCKDGYPDPKLLTKVSPENGETLVGISDEPNLETKHHRFQVSNVHLPGCMAAKEMQGMIGFMWCYFGGQELCCGSWS